MAERLALLKAELERVTALDGRLADLEAETLDPAADFLADLVDRKRSTVGDRSDRWRDSDAGQAGEEWVSSLEQVQDAVENLRNALQDARTAIGDLEAKPDT